MNLKAIAHQFTDDLSKIYDYDEAKALFFMVINHRLNFTRADFISHKEIELAIEDQDFITEVLRQLKLSLPIQYILGCSEFYRLIFSLNPSVLIPRPETEELVDWVLKEVGHIKSANMLQPSILDVGTGSGCIAISLKKNLKNVSVYAMDVCSASLAVAEENAVLNHVDVNFIEQDIFSADWKFDKLDVIVSNPPYITETEKREMHENVLSNEPHLALFVSNENPLIFYNAIADFALNYLAPNGLLFFEINEYLAKETISLLKDKGFKNIALRKDMQAKDRMIKCTMPWDETA